MGHIIKLTQEELSVTQDISQQFTFASWKLFPSLTSICMVSPCLLFSHHLVLGKQGHLSCSQWFSSDSRLISCGVDLLAILILLFFWKRLITVRGLIGFRFLFFSSYGLLRRDICRQEGTSHTDGSGGTAGPPSVFRGLLGVLVMPARLPPPSLLNSSSILPVLQPETRTVWYTTVMWASWQPGR